MTTVQISLTLPVRSGAAGARTAQSIGNSGDPYGATQVGVRIMPSPAPAVTPTEAVFTLPASGPIPTSTTLSVQAPIGADTAYITVYGPTPTPIPAPAATTCQTCAIARSPASAAVKRVSAAVRKPAVAAPTVFPTAVAALDATVQNVNLSANGTNAINAQPSPVAYQWAASNPSSGPVVGGQGYSSSLGGGFWAPFENFGQTQTGTVSLALYDAYGVQITGSLGNTLVWGGVTGVGGSVTAPGNASITYAANSNANGTASLTPTAPGFAWGSASPVAVTPDYYIFAIDTTGAYLSVFDGVTGNSVGGPGYYITLAHKRAPLLSKSARRPSSTRRTQNLQPSGPCSGIYAMDAVSASSCTSGSIAAAVALAGYNGGGTNGVEVVTVPNSPNPTPVQTFIPWPIAGTLPIPDAVAFDSSCNLYAGDDYGNLAIASLGGTFALNPLSAATFGIAALAAEPSGLVVGYYDANNNPNIGIVPLGTTGPLSPSSFSFTTASGPTDTIDALTLAGGTVWATYSQNACATSCNCYNYFQSVSGGTLASTPSLSYGFNYLNTLQMAGTTSPTTLFAATAAGYLFSVANGSSTTTQLLSGLIGGVAVSKDSPTSMVWVSQSAVSGYSPSSFGSSIMDDAVPFSGTPGGLAIAP